MALPSSTSAARAAAAAGNAAPPQAYGVVGPWRLVKLLASGEWSQVFAATPVDASQARAAYAVKLLTLQHEENAQAIACLRREAAVSGEFGHKQLIQVLAAHVDSPPYYLVMPRLVGDSLEAESARRRLSPVMCLCVIRQVAEALAALHARGWIHADVKPGNIFVSTSGHATLLDLGFARRAEELRDFVRRPLLGAPAYLAPEAFTSAYAPDARSDLYGLGVTLFELLARRRPFEGTTPAELASQHLSVAPPDLRRLSPHLPREVAALVHELLSKQPIRRPSSAQELIRRLVELEIAMFADR
jgi:serine/threonine-protein kinase